MSTRITMSALAACGLICPSAGMGEIPIATAVVGNPGNDHDSRYETPGCGGVGYCYRIGKYEVTTGQYVAFLNAVAATDAYGLYDTNMSSDVDGCKIERSGGSGNYTYSVVPERANRPVNFISWGDAARFANWLHNGQQTGPQNLTTTEDGSYYLNGATSNAALLAVLREPDATWVIPSEDEWHKAAYHKNDGATGNYFEYPTNSDELPSNLLVHPDPGNNANFDNGGYTIGDPYYCTQVGEFENSASPYGTFDQGGNVVEWTEAIEGTRRNLRAGSWFHEVSLLHASARQVGTLTYASARRGFRVARVALGAATPLAVRSLREHAFTYELAIGMGVTGGIEPRLGGVQKLEIDVDDATFCAGGATVDCLSTAWTGAVNGGVAGNTVTVEFAPPLPDQSHCVITLDCGAEVCVRNLAGDANLDGVTDPVDSNQTLLRFGQAADSSNAVWDFNVDGMIDPVDNNQRLLRFGNAVPSCP